MNKNKPSNASEEVAAPPVTPEQTRNDSGDT